VVAAAEEVECLFHGHGRNRLIVPRGFVFINVQRFNHQHFSVEVQVLASGVPVRGRDLALFDQEAAALIQPAEDPPPEFNILY